MAIVLQPERWKRWSQPQGPVEVDWSNPIAQGLSFGVAPGQRDVVSGRAAAASGSTPAVSTEGGGLSYVGDGASGAVWGARPDIAPTNSNQLTILSLVRIQNSGAVAGCVVGKVTSAWNLLLEIQNGPQQFMFGVAGSATAVATTSAMNALQPYQGKTTTFVGRYDGVSAQIHLNGRLAASAAKSGNFAANSDGFGVLNRGDGGAKLSGATVALVLIWNRALSDSEIREVSANPWQLFRPATRIPYIDLGANSASERKPATTRQSYLLGTGQPGPKPSVAPLVLRDWKRHGQPIGPADIDWSNPCTKDLSLLWRAASRTTDYGGRVLSGNGATKYDAAGPGYEILGTSTTGSLGIPKWAMNSPRGFGVLVYVRQQAQNAVWRGLIGQRDTIEGPPAWSVVIDTSNRVEVANLSGAQFGGGPTAAGEYMWLISGVSGGALNIYLNGTLFGATTCNTISSAPAKSLRLGVNRADAAEHVLGLYREVVLWDRAPTAQEARSLWLNPWQLYKPRQQRIFSGV